MKTCPNCGALSDENVKYCPTCGVPATAEAPARPNAPVSGDPYDHTHEFDPRDIADNKLYGILVYAASLLGIIVALLAVPRSPYVSFHIRQSLKLMITSVIIGFVTVVLAWTLIVPFVGGIALIIILVVYVICFVRACKGQAIEAPIVRGIGFLK
jgi:uncharacterized membrane protein